MGRLLKKSEKMKLLIKTEKPEIIEPALKKAVEELKKGYKPSRAMKFFLKMAKIDEKTINNMIFADLKKIDGNTFEFLVKYPYEEHTKHMLLSKLTNELKKIDGKIEINEKKD